MPTKPTIQEICASLGDLKPDELTKVSKTCEWLLKKQPAASVTTGATQEERLLFNCLVKSLRNANATLPADMLLQQWPPRVQGFTEDRWNRAFMTVSEFRAVCLPNILQKYNGAVYQAITDMVVQYLVEKEDTSIGMRLKFLAKKVKLETEMDEKLTFQFDSVIDQACAELRYRDPLSIPRTLDAMPHLDRIIKHSLPGYNKDTVRWAFLTMVMSYA